MHMHKKNGKRIIALLAAALVVVAAVVWVFTPAQRVALFVRTHNDDLSEIAFARLAGEPSADRYRGVRVDGLYDGEHPIVQFYTFGWGLVPYMGFYYSPDDMPAAFQNVKVELTPVGNDRWEWTDGTDNRGMTKKIDDGWYYYEAWL